MSAKREREWKIWKRVIFIGGMVLAGIFLWSVVAETMLPLWRAGDQRGFYLHLFGIPIIVLGTGIFIVGGARVVRDIWAFLFSGDDRRVADNIATIKAGKDRPAVRAAQKENAGLWLRAVGQGGLIMAAGFLTIAIGSYIINL